MTHGGTRAGLECVARRPGFWLAVLAVSAAVARPTTALAERSSRPESSSFRPDEHGRSRRRSRIAVGGLALIFNERRQHGAPEAHVTDGRHRQRQSSPHLPGARRWPSRCAGRPRLTPCRAAPCSGRPWQPRRRFGAGSRERPASAGPRTPSKALSRLTYERLLRDLQTGIWTILKVPIAGGPPIALVTTDKASSGSGHGRHLLVLVGGALP